MGWWGCKCKCRAGWRRGEARGKGGDSADRAGRGRGGEIVRGEDLS